MKTWNALSLFDWHERNFEPALHGRHITLNHIEPLLTRLATRARVQKIGVSGEHRAIYSVRMGSGKRKVLIWTQMHGNESTGTKALFDLFAFLSDGQEFREQVHIILRELELICIPILNPDGAQAYTRKNAGGIDLNRDVIEKKAIESALLQQVLKEEQPEYCFNMHDQRTVFSVGPNRNTATISFLAPSEDENRSITAGRIETMKAIVSMNELLQEVIPGRVGRYTDEFYPTATGDNFQKMGHNTILVESGHSKGDYAREESRKYTFIALLQGVYFIASSAHASDYRAYFDIPDNEQFYLDVIVKGVKLEGQLSDLGVLFQERLEENSLKFIPTIEKTGDLSKYNCDRSVPGSSLEFSDRNEAESWVQNHIN